MNLSFYVRHTYFLALYTEKAWKREPTTAAMNSVNNAEKQFPVQRDRGKWWILNL